MLTGAGITLMVTVFIASAVESVEAFTIVLAMGLTRSWRAALVGAASAFVLLAAVTTALMFVLDRFVSKIQSIESLLQLIIGVLLMIFGMQWLRKAILRATGLKALHDEDEIFRKEQESARNAESETRMGLDWFAYVVSFKGVFLEGIEVVFIVITFGLAASSDPVHPVARAMLVGALGAAAAAALVAVAGALAHKPLSKVPENTMKFAVGLLLTTFGIFWGVEGLGFFHIRSQSLQWPTGNWALIWILAALTALSLLTVRVLRKSLATRQNTETLPVGEEYERGSTS